jgi:hypothetical protein
MFDYIVGETLRFSVGGVQLGTLPDGQAVVTPYDFGAAAENIARLLQTLDADANHLNGIDLAAAAIALAGTAMDASTFTSDATTFENAIQPVLDTALILRPGPIRRSTWQNLPAASWFSTCRRKARPES